MYAAWNPTPTVSDSTKLAVCENWLPKFGVGSPPTSKTGGRIYGLLLLVSISDDFANLNDWTETDSGANVTLAAGVVHINGNGSYAANGIAYTDGIARAIGYIEYKARTQDTGVNGLFEMGNSALGLRANANCLAPGIAFNSANGLNVRQNSGAITANAISVTANTWYTVRHYVLNTNWTEFMTTLEGGAQFSTETMVTYTRIQSNVIADPFYPQFQNATNNDAKAPDVKEFRWYTGLSAAGPTLTYVMDCGANRAYSDIDLTNVAAVGGWSTTNVTFAWSCDDGVAAYTAEHTLAQMQAHGALTESHRYFRLRITVNSDGSTQQYAGEMNASDLVTSIISTAEVWPSEDDVRDGEDYGPTGADYTGNLTLPAVGDVQDGVQYGTDGTEFEGTFTEPGVGNVEFGVQYGAGGVEFTGTFVVPVEGDVELGVDYGAAAEFTGTFAAPAESDVRDGVGYGAAGVEFTGDVVLPAEGDVENGVGYGSGGVEHTGNVTLPAVGDVQTGVQYGAGGVEFTGTFDAPTEGDVRDGVGYGAGGVEFTGDVELPAEGDVEFGVGYGSQGIEFTGAFVVPSENDVENGVTYGNAAEFTGNFVVPSEDDVEFGVSYGSGAEFTGNFVVPAEATVQLGVGYGAGGVEFTGTLVGGGGWDPDEVDGIDVGLTAREAMRLMVAVLCGRTTVVPGTPGHAVFRDTANTKDRVDATMVGSERVDVDYDKS